MDEASMPPVYMSRAGVICCAGTDAESAYHSAVNGDRSGVRAADRGGMRFLIGEADAPAVDEAVPSLGKDTKLLRLVQYASEQLREEVDRARRLFGADRIGVCAGSCDNGSELSLPAHRAFFASCETGEDGNTADASTSGGAFPAGYTLSDQSAQTPAVFLSELFGAKGPVFALATACASSASAIIKGAELIRAGFCDAVIAGGVDIVSETVAKGFAALEAVSDDPCNPFSKNRRGINLGEGAAFFLLSKEPPLFPAHPIKLRGWGESADAYHITSPKPEGTGAAAAMRSALAMAALDGGDCGYINLHGTATLLNDAMEACAVQAVFGGADLPPAVPVSSTKSVTGHTLGAWKPPSAGKPSPPRAFPVPPPFPSTTGTARATLPSPLCASCGTAKRLKKTPV